MLYFGKHHQILPPEIPTLETVDDDALAKKLKVIFPSLVHISCRNAYPGRLNYFCLLCVRIKAQRVLKATFSSLKTCECNSQRIWNRYYRQHDIEIRRRANQHNGEWSLHKWTGPEEAVDGRRSWIKVHMWKQGVPTGQGDGKMNEICSMKVSDVKPKRLPTLMMFASRLVLFRRSK